MQPRTEHLTRHFPAGQEARSASAFPVLRFRSSSPSEATTWTWRHSLKHSFYGHPQPADTIIATGHVFVNFAQKVRQNMVPKLVPNMPVLELNFTFWSFFLEPSKSCFQSVSRQKHVSWVHILSTKINYFPKDEGRRRRRNSDFQPPRTERALRAINAGIVK